MSTYSLPNISLEQQEIVDAILDFNVICSAVAGSGKTTCCCHLAQTYSTWKILLLTYNAKLKDETRERIRMLNINNMEVHSYHAFCRKYYNNSASRDNDIIEIVRNNIPPIYTVHYDLVIFDESQDVTELYFKFIAKFMRDFKLSTINNSQLSQSTINNSQLSSSTINNSQLPQSAVNGGQLSVNCRICVLGDQYQSIFKFNGADERFLTKAPLIWKFNDRPWIAKPLSTSYRLTREIADIINVGINSTNKRYINTIKRGRKPEYHVINMFGSEPGKIIQRLMKEFASDEMFILAASIKGDRSPIVKTANKLSAMGIPIYIPNNDDEKLDVDVLTKKLVFSTFHQVKGLERKCVVIFGFDENYLKYYNKRSKGFPNELYVAITRASEHVVILHEKKSASMPFIDVGKMTSICDLSKNQIPNINGEVQQTELLPDRIGVTELIRYLPSEVSYEFYQSLSIEQLKVGNQDVVLSTKIQNEDLYETTFEINGVAIPAYYEMKRYGLPSIFKELKKHNSTNLKETDTKNISWILQLANEYCAYKSKYIFKLNQIKEYNWITDHEMTILTNRLDARLADVAFEFPLIDVREPNILGTKIIGSADCIGTTRLGTHVLWEFKCCTELKSEHFMQLAIYTWIWEGIRQKEKIPTVYRYMLYNILTDEIWELKYTPTIIDHIIKIIETKYGTTIDRESDAFITTCLGYL